MIRLLSISLVACILLSGCVSAWILNTGKPVQLSTREAVIRAYGQPVARGSVSDGSAVGHWLQGDFPSVRNFELFRYRGLVQDEEGAGGAATVNAITLGAGEVVTLPLALLDRATTGIKEHLFVAGYDQNHHFVTFLELQQNQ